VGHCRGGVGLKDDTPATLGRQAILRVSKARSEGTTCVSAEEEVRQSLGELRRGQGLSAIALDGHNELLRQLGTDDPFVAYERLSQLVYKLGDGRPGVTLQAALAVGVDRLKDAQERRAAIESKLRISDSARWRDERDALTALTRLVMSYDPFKATADAQLSESGYTADFVPTEPNEDRTHQAASTDEVDPLGDDRADEPLGEDDHATADVMGEAADQADAGRRAKVRMVLDWSRRMAAPRNPRYRPPGRYEVILIAICAGALISVGALMYTGVIPRPGHHPGIATPTAGVVTNAPVDKFDNRTGWGPKRQTYTMEQPASSPVLNSITDNPVQGDERNFFQCRDLGMKDAVFADQVIEYPGHTYECYLFFDNDTAPNLAQWAAPNLGENPLAMLHDTTARVLLPSAGLQNPGLEAHLSASNVLPPAPSDVWDSCEFIGFDKITLSYVPGSARMVTNATPKDGTPLKGDATLTTTGALIGDDQDGYLGQNAGYITFKILVQAA